MEYACPRRNFTPACTELTIYSGVTPVHSGETPHPRRDTTDHQTSCGRTRDILRLRKVTTMAITLALLRRAGVAQKLVCLPPQNPHSQCRVIALSLPNNCQE